MKKFLVLFLILAMLTATLLSCNKRYLEAIYDTSDSTSVTTADNTSDFSLETTDNVNSENDITDKAMAAGEKDTTEITSETQSIQYPEDYNYTIKKVDGKWYMNFDSYDVPPISEGSHMEPNFTFPSFEELYDTVVVKKALNNSKKIDIITFWGKTDHGIEIINFDDLYIPVLPEAFEMTSVVWNRNAYGVTFKNRESGQSAGRVYASFANEFNAMMDGITEQNENKYILTDGDKTILVEKMVFDGGLDIDLYIKQGDKYCIVTLSDLTESPTNEFFLKFGLKKWQKPE